MRVEAKKPSECSSSEVKAFEDLVTETGEVQTRGFSELVARAERLIFLYSDDGALAGVAAIKQPNNGYKQKVFHRAKSQEDPDLYIYELGWIAIKEAFRGRHLSRDLVEAALNIVAGAKVYATTKTNNERMRRTNERYGFRVSGEPYTTSRKGGNYDLSLFVRE